MTVLPFYTSTGQRDAERVWSQDALLSPIQNFLPWQIQRDHLASTYLESIVMVDCDAAETDVLDYFRDSENLVGDWDNGSLGDGFDTFDDDSTGNILTAIANSAPDVQYCVMPSGFSLATGESIIIDYDLTLNSGALPWFYLGLGIGSDIYSDYRQVSTGANSLLLTATGMILVMFIFA